MANGLHANQSGKRLENHAAEVLDDLGYSKVLSKHFFDLKSRVGNPIYARQCYAGTSLYGRRRRVDIILHHPEKWKDCLVIQCKWQSEKGTVDEKYPLRCFLLVRTAILQSLFWRGQAIDLNPESGCVLKQEKTILFMFII